MMITIFEASEYMSSKHMRKAVFLYSLHISSVLSETLTTVVSSGRFFRLPYKRLTTAVDWLQYPKTKYFSRNLVW